MKFRNRPIEVEAWRVVAPSEVVHGPPPPLWLVDALLSGDIAAEPARGLMLQGEGLAAFGDWIVRAPSGDLSILSDDEFRERYEAVVEFRAARPPTNGDEG